MRFVKILKLCFNLHEATSQTDMRACPLGDCRDNERNSQSMFRLVRAEFTDYKTLFVLIDDDYDKEGFVR